MDSVRWNIAVSSETDQSVRMLLNEQGGGHKGDLSSFVEEAVRSYILDRFSKQAKDATSGMSETAVNDLIAKAVQWAREH